jgi:hypothetical protein
MPIRLLGTEFYDSCVLYALDENEDRLILKPAKAHIEWLRERTALHLFESSNLGGISKMLEKLKELPQKPVLIEIIAHGTIDGNSMGSVSELAPWSIVAQAIAAINKGQKIVVNAMSSCVSYALVDALSSNISNVFASNLTSSERTFSHIRSLYTVGLERLKFTIELAAPNEYTWYINNVRENQIDWKKRYELLYERHGNDCDWPRKYSSLKNAGRIP